MIGLGLTTVAFRLIKPSKRLTEGGQEMAEVLLYGKNMLICGVRLVECMRRLKEASMRMHVGFSRIALSPTNGGVP